MTSSKEEQHNVLCQCEMQSPRSLWSHRASDMEEVPFGHLPMKCSTVQVEFLLFTQKEKKKKASLNFPQIRLCLIHYGIMVPRFSPVNSLENVL